MKTNLARIVTFLWLVVSSSCCNGGGSPPPGPPEETSEVVPAFEQISRSTKWRLVDSVRLRFQTYHPQGMVKIGDSFYMSTVWLPFSARGVGEPVSDSVGVGKILDGYLLRFDASGTLQDRVSLGEGLIFHPGGIDYDGQYIWVPVSVYMPDSEAIIYRIDPVTMESQAMFRFDDHIGTIAYDTRSNRLIGSSWGSRRYYVWDMNAFTDESCPEPPCEPPPWFMQPNSECYIDYQDCHFLQAHFMLCSGLAQYDVRGAGKVAFGGIDLVDLDTLLPIHQVPVNLRVSPDLVMTNNPFFVEKLGESLRFYFVPENNPSTLYIYDTKNG